MIAIEKKKILNLPIPEGEKGMEDIIAIADEGLVKDLEIKLGIIHPFKGDLYVDITSPNGTKVTLHDRQGGAEDDILKTYKKDIFKAFLGQPAQGEWRLKIIDAAPKDKGHIEFWKIRIEIDSY